MSTFDTIPWRFSSALPKKDYLRSVGQNIILVKKPSVQALIGQPFKTGNFAFLLCTKGSIVGEINMAERTLNGGGLIFIRPEQVVQFTSVSEDFEMHLLVASKEFLSRLDIHITEVLPVKFIGKMQDSPIIKLQRRDVTDVLAIFNLLFRVAINDDNPFLENTILNVMRAFCYESGYYIVRNNPDVLIPEKNSIVEKLIPLIKQHFRQHKDIGYYAEKLNLSPNYLDKLVMTSSGRSVREWIEEYVVTEAKAQLRSTTKSIKEISDDLNFPSQTFFGKYFKRITGTSPKKYREMIDN